MAIPNRKRTTDFDSILLEYELCKVVYIPFYAKNGFLGEGNLIYPIQAKKMKKSKIKVR